MTNYYKGTLNGDFDSVFQSLLAFENIKSIEISLPESDMRWGCKISSKMVKGIKEFPTMMTIIILQAKPNSIEVNFEIIISLNVENCEINNPVKNQLEKIVYALKKNGKNLKFKGTSKTNTLIGNVESLNRPSLWICPNCHFQNSFLNDACPQCFQKRK